eukprot:scaffold133817_cov32-Tisochrysis_lutea.AAC.3
MRVASAGPTTSAASPPAKIPAINGPTAPLTSGPSPSSTDANGALTSSYEPNLSAPSTPYPTMVGTRPVSSAAGPSS